MQDLQEKIEKVQQYLEFLRTLDVKLLEDEVNLDVSTTDTEDLIERTFSLMRKNLLEELEIRQNLLLNIVREFYVAESTSLKNRIQDVEKNVEILENLVDLQENPEQFYKTYQKYIDSVRNDCLNLSIQKSVRINAQFEGKDKLINSCKHFGRISTGAPLKICKTLPQPGSILIQWDVIEKNLDIEQFCLQKMQVPNNSFDKLKQKFEDVFVGFDMEFLDKNVIHNEYYAYRVCLKYENQSKWSEWSIPKLAISTLKPLCWKNNSNYKFSSDNIIAECLAEKSVIMYSTKFSFNPGYYIEIKFLHCDENHKNVFVGLSATEDYVENVMDLKKALFIEANGNIFTDGLKKTTRLPPINEGRKVVFICEKYINGKMRIHIDNHNMRVTYDWNVETPEIFVCASFNSPKWKISIN